MKTFASVLLVLSLMSCGSRYPGYKEMDSGHFRKQITLGDEGSSGLISTYFGLMLTFNPDSVNRQETFLLVHPEELYKYFSGEELLHSINVMKEREVVRYILPYAELKNLFASGENESEERMAELEVKLEKRFSDQDNVCSYFMHQAQEGFMPETDAIKLCQSTMDKTWEDFGKISMSWITRTESDSVKVGRDVSVEYNTYWLDGVRKDSLTSMNMSFGKPGQLIPGLQYGLSLMREGERALIYMPSELAFGEEGSRTGIIPPKTPIYFDVRISNVITESEKK